MKTIYNFLASNQHSASNFIASDNTLYNEIQLQEMRKNELEKCIIVEKPALRKDNSQLSKHSSERITPSICYCNHMAAHRHIHMKEIPIPSSGGRSLTKHLNSSSITQEIVMGKSTEMLEQQKLQIIETDRKTFKQNASLDLTNIQQAPMTERNWNDSEPRNFTINNSKSNADIAESLKIFKDTARKMLN